MEVKIVKEVKRSDGLWQNDKSSSKSAYLQHYTFRDKILYVHYGRNVIYPICQEMHVKQDTGGNFCISSINGRVTHFQDISWGPLWKHCLCHPGSRNRAPNGANNATWVGGTIAYTVASTHTVASTVIMENRQMAPPTNTCPQPYWHFPYWHLSVSVGQVSVGHVSVGQVSVKCQ